MKVGDLVCYNTAGQRKKTVGMVLGIRDVETSDVWEENLYGEQFQIVQILWALAPSMPPRAYSGNGYFMSPKKYHKSPTWYVNLGWFDVVKPS